jgi:hypothetical protein
MRSRICLTLMGMMLAVAATAAERVLPDKIVDTGHHCCFSSPNSVS